jgi:exopolysaccharide production protein ExoZ
VEGQASKPGGVLQNLQVLRAIAASLVVLAHIATLNEPLLLPWLGWGTCGVDLFFVISGFVMVHTTSGKPVTPSQFALNRIIRIVPLYWGLTIAVFLVALLMPSLLKSTQADWLELVKSLLFVPFEKSNGQVQPMLFLGWTLNYEMFFYALFAISLVITSLHKRMAAMALILVSLVIAGAVLQPQGVVIRFYTNSILLEFLFGMGLAYAKSLYDLRRVAMVWPILALIVALVLSVYAPAAGASGWNQIYARGLPAALVVLAAVVLEARGKFHSSNALLLLGAASYMLYLTHPFTYIPIEKLAHRLQLTDGPTLYFTILVQLIAIVGVAVALHILVERPVTGSLRRRLQGDSAVMQWRNAAALWPWRRRAG